MEEPIEQYKCIETDCQNIIYFGSKDREYYISRGWVDHNGEPVRPKRCRTCRLKRKNQKDASITLT